jgi:cytochrome bd-type quinol oxidase subunit 2
VVFISVLMILNLKADESLSSATAYFYFIFYFGFFQGFLMTHRILKDEDGTKTDTDATSGSNTRSIVLIVILVLVVLGLVSFFLFKLWRKKKREEQYARLLKLFEQDDELELELGLRD